MSDEDDEHPVDRLIRAQERAQRASQTQDALVFTLTGKEIEGRLLLEAERAEKTADEDEAMAKDGPRPTGYPPGTLAGPLRRQAEIFRFLAAHVDESRIFRLGTYDLAFIGLGSMLQ